MAKKGKVKTTNKRTRNNTANKTKRKTKNTTKPDERDPIIEDEIILIITLLISVLIFLSYFDLSGQVGIVISGLIFGMIGSLSYLLPFVLFFAIAFYLSNRGNKIARRRLISLVVFFVSLTAFIQLLTLSYNPEMKIQEYYKSSALLRRGGGIIGGIQVKIYYGLFDKLASYIILIAIMTITIMIITGKAIISNLKKLSSYLVNKGQESWKAHRMEEDHDTTELEEDYDNKRPSRAPAKTVDIKPKDLEAHFFRKSSKDKVHKEKPNKNKLKKQYKKEKQLEKENNIEAESHSYIEEELANKFGRVSTNIEKDQEVAEIKKSEKSVVEGKTIHVNKPAKASQPKNIIKANSMPQAIEEESVIEHTLSNVEINNIYEQKPEDEKALSDINKPVQVEKEKIETKDSKTGDYIYPPIELLEEAKNKSKGIANESLKETALKLQTTLESFGVKVEISNISCGPSVTRYELQPEQGVKVSKITSLADDIKLNLAAADIRIEAPIPGKAAVGIEVPNKVNSMVSLRGMIESDAFDSHPSNISFVVGKDIGGKEVIADIGSMPHLLIAGATGSGKSVCINTIIMSIIYKSSPDDVKLIMIDPKIVELSSYNGIPHLMIPVVTDPKKASNALFWAVSEMTDRYKKFASVNARDMKGYNKIIEEDEYKDNIEHTRLPQIVIIIDELADLMMVAPGEVEDSICRLAQMARAAGIHLIIATQRPSVNVITGLIKANIPSRIAFAVSSAIDSRTILDGSGAEKLLGRGDMLFFPAGYPKPIRVQGAFVSDKEVRETVKFVKENNSGNGQTPYSEDVAEKILSEIPVASAGIPDERDEYFAEVGKFIIEKEQSSIGMIQRVYRVGFNRAARIMDQLEAAGLVGPSEGTKAREILMTMDEFEHWLEENKAG